MHVTNGGLALTIQRASLASTDSTPQMADGLQRMDIWTQNVFHISSTLRSVTRALPEECRPAGLELGICIWVLLLLLHQNLA